MLFILNSYVPGDEIMVHITALESMAAQLNDLGVSVTDHDIMTKITCSLPSRFDNLVSSWDGMAEVDKTLEALRARLVSEERKITLRNSQGQTNNGGSNDQTQGHGNGAFYGNSSNEQNYSRPYRHRGRGGRGYRGNQQQNHVIDDFLYQ